MVIGNRHSVMESMRDRIEEKPGLLAGHYIISVVHIAPSPPYYEYICLITIRGTRTTTDTAPRTVVSQWS